MIRPMVASHVLDAALSDAGRHRLEQRSAEVARDPRLLDRVFPAVAREIGRGVFERSGRPVQVADAARVQLLAAAEVTAGPALVEEVRTLYRYGDADEKRAVLHALNGWDDDAVDAHDVLEDALRTNDTRLVEAAMGAHAGRLDPSTWRQGVLKCLFTGVPVAAVADLETRADAELGAMSARYAREREAAGRPVPEDVRVVRAACPDPTTPAEEL